MSLRCVFEHDEKTRVAVADDMSGIQRRLAAMEISPAKWVSVYEYGNDTPVAKAYTDGDKWVEL